MNENLSPPVEERDSFRINPHESEYGTIIASILLLLDLEPRIRDSNSANSNVFLREWNNDISRYSRWEHRKLRRAFSRNIEFTEASQPSIYSSRKPTSPNFHASSLLWEYAALVKRGKFAVNFRQGHEPALISTLDPILLNRDTIIYFVKLNLKRVGDEKFHEERIFEKIFALCKRKFHRSWKFEEFREAYFVTLGRIENSRR